MYDDVYRRDAFIYSFTNFTSVLRLYDDWKYLPSFTLRKFIQKSSNNRAMRLKKCFISSFTSILYCDEY